MYKKLSTNLKSSHSEAPSKSGYILITMDTYGLSNMAFKEPSEKDFMCSSSKARITPI